MQMMTNQHSDSEAIALAACYRLLLQKARERRERLAQETAVVQVVDNQPADHDQDESLPEGS